jgi:toxin ParE1/3/4
LTEIWLYGFSRWGVVQADRYLDELGNRIDLLARTPDICRLRSEFTPPVRICRYTSHLIIYTATDDTLTVVRVLHARSDLNSRL